MTNDRFRFRVWDKNGNSYISEKDDADFLYLGENGKLTVGLYNGDADDIAYLKEEDSIIEQCTGLKDKNGKLIYEGDIVRIFYDHFNGTFTEKEVVGPVKWECGTWAVNNSFLHHSPEYDETHLESAAVEVIGNIHENSELLEENNGIH